MASHKIKYTRFQILLKVCIIILNLVKKQGFGCWQNLVPTFNGTVKLLILDHMVSFVYVL